MRLSKAKKVLLNSLLKYVEGAASKYYSRHYKLFEGDTLSLDDLKQEAKIICLKLFREYHSMHEVNEFDVKKFIARAVGWKLRDLMNCAITESTYFYHGSPREQSIDNYGSVMDITDTKDPNYDLYDELSSDLKYGFNLEEVFSHFQGNDLTILKNMLKCKDDKVNLTKGKNKLSQHYIKTAWTKRLLPKLQSLLSKQNKEL